MTSTTLRGRGQLTLPPEVRDALHVEDGDEIQFELTDEGVVVMHGMKKIPADQAWFWTQSWQRGEKEASDEIRRRETTVHKTVEDMFEYLES